VVAFTGGVGESSPSMRARILSGLEFLGLVLDEDRNAGVRLAGSEAPQIQREHSRVRVMVTRTREQWMIARETARGGGALRLRVLGPCREANQIEIAATEAYKLGIDVPVPSAKVEKARQSSTSGIARGSGLQLVC
jgi:hypothetical protein